MEGRGGENNSTRVDFTVPWIYVRCFEAGFKMNFPCKIKENALCGWGTILDSHELEFLFCRFLLLAVETSNMSSFCLARSINKQNLDAWKSRVGESKESQNQQNERHIELLLLMKRS